MSFLPPFKPENNLQIEKIIEQTSTPLLQVKNCEYNLFYKVNESRYEFFDWKRRYKC